MPKIAKRNTRTEPLARVLTADREETKKWLPIYDEYAASRPKTRGDCENGERPCPWISCSANAYLDVKEHGKSITYNFPNIEPEDMKPNRSCTLDIADWGGASLTDIAAMMNLTRERVRQIQEIAIRKVRRHSSILAEFPDDLERRTEISNTTTRSSLTLDERPRPEPQEPSEEELNLLSGDTYKFLSDHVHADRLVAARVWRIYLYDSVKRGFEKDTRPVSGQPDTKNDNPETISLRIKSNRRHNGRYENTRK